MAWKTLLQVGSWLNTFGETKTSFYRYNFSSNNEILALCGTYFFIKKKFFLLKYWTIATLLFYIWIFLHILFVQNLYSVFKGNTSAAKLDMFKKLCIFWLIFEMMNLCYVYVWLPSSGYGILNKTITFSITYLKNQN